MKRLDLLETCTYYPTTRNVYADLVLGTPTTLSCMYRNITSFIETGYKEQETIVGIFWFNVKVYMGDVVSYGGQLFKIEKLTTAKANLTDGGIHFYKCEVSLYRGIS